MISDSERVVFIFWRQLTLRPVCLLVVLSRRGREYESTLSKALDQRELPTEGPLHDKAARARCGGA